MRTRTSNGKTKSSDLKIVKRKGRVYVINKKDSKLKQNGKETTI